MIRNYFHLLFLPLLILIFNISAHCQNLEIQDDKLSDLIKQLEKQQDPEQFQLKLDSIAKYTDIHDFILKRLPGTNRTAVHHVYYEPYLDYACDNMDSRFRDSIKSMVKSNECDPYQLPRLFICVFDTDQEICSFLNSFVINEADSVKHAFYDDYVKLIKSKRSKCFDKYPHTNLDSFEIQKKILEKRYELEYSEFDSLIIVLSKYGDIHDYVIQRIGESRRTPGMHEYYPAFSSFICQNMDSVYRKRIIEMIDSDSIQRSIAYPIVKGCLFESEEETCKYLNSQNFEEKFNNTQSLLYESLLKLEKIMKCSM